LITEKRGKELEPPSQQKELWNSELGGVNAEAARSCPSVEQPVAHYQPLAEFTELSILLRKGTEKSVVLRIVTMLDGKSELRTSR